MKVVINGVQAELPEKLADSLVQDILQIALELYAEKLDDKVKLALQAVTRMMLVKAEIDTRMKFGKEAARQLRPPAKSDPTLWLVNQSLPMVKESLRDINLSCEIESGTITDIGVSTKSTDIAGRQVDTTRNFGMRENNRAKVS